MSFYAALLQLRAPSPPAGTTFSDAEKRKTNGEYALKQLADLGTLYKIQTRTDAIAPPLTELIESKDRISQDRLGLDMMNGMWNLFDAFWEKDDNANSWDDFKIKGANGDAQKIQTRRPKPDFRHDGWEYRGVDPTRPAVPAEELFANAKSFLQYRDVFCSWEILRERWRFVPSSYFFQPQSLFKFYDERRAELSDTLPYAFGVILLSCSFFLSFRLADYDNSQVRSGARKRMWVELQSRPSIFSNPALIPMSVAFVFLALGIEFFANEPTTQVEWYVNVPIMVLSAIALSILWVTLYDIIANVSINPELKVLTVAARVQRFRYFSLGLVSVCFVMVWAIGDSYYRVMRHGSDRAVLQIAISSITLALVVMVGLKIFKQVSNLPVPAAGSGKDDPQKPVPNWHPFSHILPAASENMTQAILLSLFPLKTALGWLLIK